MTSTDNDLNGPTGLAFIAGGQSHEGPATFRGKNPATGAALEPPFGEASAANVAQTTALAEAAFDVFRETAPEIRAAFLETIAANILALGDELVDRAMAESGLPRGRIEGERDFGVSLLWIFDAVRHFGSAEAQRVVELAVQYQGRNVVGFGIGGDERRAGPELFRDVYAYGADHGLRLTAHAGETTGPESIWGALNLRAERIGHGLTAQQDSDLMQELSQRQVPVEICVTSNLKTGVCPAIAEHPVKRYFDEGVMVTLNTDDPAMFGTSLSKEYQLVQENFGFSDEHLRELARNSFEAAFLNAEKKLEFLNLFDAVPART